MKIVLAVRCCLAYWPSSQQHLIGLNKKKNWFRRPILYKYCYGWRDGKAGLMVGLAHSCPEIQQPVCKHLNISLSHTDID